MRDILATFARFWALGFVIAAVAWLFDADPWHLAAAVALSLALRHEAS